ncbi:MAG: methionine--tRNA ligase [Patescibacteria group bacterium]|nr:MAG: methionine--tRNA ligase [Patescibacteria group bacterium]
MKDTFYITTTLPYVNADPHIGFALELVQTDIIARAQRLSGKDVFFNTGTDEHGQKIYQKAQEERKDPQAYVDEFAARFGLLKEALNVSYDSFSRTTDPAHIASAQEFWRKCDAAGDIYKKNYKVKYCVGCELEKTDSELEDDRCPLHPDKELEIREEENYFFRFSKYQDKLLALYKENLDFVVPDMRLREITKFVERGLQDFSISRLKAKMPWGVPVPGDPDHIMYVWFDALVNYISAIGWPSDMEKFEKWWPVVQVAGKDNLRQQAAMWQAMLMSAGLLLSRQIIIHGFITSGGKKMSKSAGNVINPFDLVEEYGTDALRYFLAREVNPFEDSDVTMERFKEAYNANLANGLGNLVSRIMKMVTSYDVRPELPSEEDVLADDQTGVKDILNELSNFSFQKAADGIWAEIGNMDFFIQSTQPFKLIKTDEKKAKEYVEVLVIKLWYVAIMLTPLLPTTAEKIKSAIKNHEMPEPLFMRK